MTTARERKRDTAPPLPIEGSSAFVSEATEDAGGMTNFVVVSRRRSIFRLRRILRDSESIGEELTRTKEPASTIFVKIMCPPETRPIQVYDAI